jgi:hypothetical protein
MKFTNKIRYSPLEQRILDLLPKDGTKINTLELTGMVYRPGEAPLNARQTVMHGANKLILKSDENEEPWEIFKSSSKGAQPAYFWISDRVSKRNDKSSEKEDKFQTG